MDEPSRCASPRCGSWTWRSDGFCSDECAAPPERRPRYGARRPPRPRHRPGDPRGTAGPGWLRFQYDLEQISTPAERSA